MAELTFRLPDKELSNIAWQQQHSLKSMAKALSFLNRFMKDSVVMENQRKTLVVVRTNQIKRFVFADSESNAMRHVGVLKSRIQPNFL